MKKFYIIGIDDNGQREFQAEVREIIITHRVFSGGKRHYELMRDRLPEQYVWIDITVPLEEVFEKYAAYCEVVVFASGDPLFFRICQYGKEPFTGSGDTSLPLVQFFTNAGSSFGHSLSGYGGRFPYGASVA